MIAAFYSFNPEVGCVTAAVNIGILLCQEFAKRVLVVDLNFSTPKLTEALQEIRKTPQASLIDILLGYQKIIDGELPITHERLTLARDHVNATSIPGFDYLPASTEANSVNSCLATFSWYKFYSEYYGGALLEYIRHQWIEAYDYVFVISGKGFTDSASICTIQLADIIVLMMDMSPRGLEGSIEFTRKVNVPGIKRDGRTITILPVPSKVPAAEYELSRGYLEKFESSFSKYLPNKIDASNFFDEVKIRELLYYSSTNKIAVLHGSKDDPMSTCRSYLSLSQYFIDLAESGS